MLQEKLKDLQESLQQETKSTAGDKYETGRAMVHIEQENTNRQHAELLLQQAELGTIDITLVSSIAIKGSLVETDRGLFFLSASLGKAIVEGREIYALSPRSPLGQHLLGCTPGKSIVVNKTNYTVKNVY